MDRQVGNPHFAFWLLGDSEPDNWKKDLRSPFDSRHPIRHNIWTSVLDVLQDEVFRQTRKRFETNDLFIRNAVGNVKHKPSGNTVSWHDNTLSEITTFKKLIVQYKPVIICRLDRSLSSLLVVLLKKNHRTNIHTGILNVLGHSFARAYRNSTLIRLTLYPFYIGAYQACIF